ncbi:ABC transporter permease [Luteolibacter pohnpeiensis]|uniref:ABC transporter permease n=1 Tax=Luteolibacter pohnpeiensis TaxID=454153 RepID=A0A934VUV2_9BACT|nr:ABC transporter permease [Luteolibacter pohnpeiensis]MBK1881525.1 ABC transporter permease [Luteolibacter pohnpeiensis]
MILRFHRTLSLGVKNLLLHKVRSCLTMLGIVFGVGSVIAMLAVGEGASQEASRSIASLGSSNIILESVEPPREPDNPLQTGSKPPLWTQKYGLTEADRARITNTIPNVIRVHPETERTDEVMSASSRQRAILHATWPECPEIRNIQRIEGRFFTQLELERAMPVCVISPSLRRKLFPFGSAVGEFVRIEGDYYTIVGEYSPGASEVEDEGKEGAETVARDDILYLPINTARARVTSFIYGRTQYDTLVVQTTGTQHVSAIGESIESLMDHTHADHDFRIVVPLELLAQARKTQRLFNVIIGSIAAISLLVGGIGIMNIMLATVTERTREIGVRRALGARRVDIVSQFLVETVVISLVGGLTGVLVGLGIPGIITSLTNLPTVVTASSVLFSVIVSVLIGVVFGIYPARRAASLDPIDALRM